MKTRKEFERYGLNTIVSSRGQSKEYLATFVERQTQFYLAIKIENCSVAKIYRPIQPLTQVLPTDVFKFFTVN